MKHGKKFPTSLYQQTFVLTKRSFIQRRGDLLGWNRIMQMTHWSVVWAAEAEIPDRTGTLQ